MMKIEWSLDKDSDNGIEPDELLGAIRIVSGKDMIYDDCTYIDVWFDALISGFYCVSNNKYSEYDLKSEPDSLIFKPQKGGLKIKYGNSSVHIKSVDEFRSELFRASRSFLADILKTVKKEHIILFKDIIIFVSSFNKTEISDRNER